MLDKWNVRDIEQELRPVNCEHRHMPCSHCIRFAYWILVNRSCRVDFASDCVHTTNDWPDANGMRMVRHVHTASASRPVVTQLHDLWHISPFPGHTYPSRLNVIWFRCTDCHHCLPQPIYVVLRRWQQSVGENNVRFSWNLERVAL